MFSKTTTIGILQHGILVSQEGESNISPLNFHAVALIVEQTFVKSVNAGQKCGHRQRIQLQSEPSVIFELCNVEAVSKLSPVLTGC